MSGAANGSAITALFNPAAGDHYTQAHTHALIRLIFKQQFVIRNFRV